MRLLSQGVLIAALLSVVIGRGEAQTLGTAEGYAVLAGSTVTNTGPTVIAGDVGVSPGTAITGFPPGMLTSGVIHDNDASAAQAQSDLTVAYNTLSALPFQVDLTGKNLGGLVLVPDVYRFSSSAQLTGVLTLNGLGSPSSQFVFQIGSSLTTASNSAVLLVNGANANNVYWVVGSSATLGTNSIFAGNIVALTSITLNTGAKITCGRALARNGATTLDTNTIELCTPSSRNGGGSSDITLPQLFGSGIAGAAITQFSAAGLFGSAMLAQATYLRSEDTGWGGLKDGWTDRRANEWRLWTVGLGETGWMPGLDYHSVGFAVGIDYQVDDSFMVGIAGGHTNSGFGLSQVTGNLEGAHGGVYALKSVGPLYVVGSLEYGRFFNSEDRSINWVISENASGKFVSDEYAARTEVGLRRQVGGFNVTPFIEMEAVHLAEAGFTESSFRVSGGPGILGAAFGSSKADRFDSSVGVQLDTKYSIWNGQMLVPFVRAAWVHSWEPDPLDLNAHLVVSPAATSIVGGIISAPDLAKVDAGIRMELAGNMAVYVSFEGEFAPHETVVGGKAGFKISW